MFVAVRGVRACMAGRRVRAGVFAGLIACASESNVQDMNGKVYYENHQLHKTTWSFPASPPQTPLPSAMVCALAQLRMRACRGGGGVVGLAGYRGVGCARGKGEWSRAMRGGSPFGDRDDTCAVLARTHAHMHMEHAHPLTGTNTSSGQGQCGGESADTQGAARPSHLH